MSDVHNLIKKVRSEKDLDEVWANFEFPCCDIRALELVPILEALAKKDIDTALILLSQISDAYLIKNEFSGLIITFIVAANSGDYDDAQLNMISLIQYFQTFEHIGFMNYLVPYLIKTHLPEAEWLWNFKTLDIKFNGQVYYAMPIMIHNSAAEGENRDSTPWIEMKPSDSVHLEDVYGRKYMSVETAIANTSLAVTNVASNLAANAIIQTASVIFNMVTNGKFDVVTLSSVKKLVVEKNTEMPLNSCGYIITRDKVEFDSWLVPDNNNSIKDFDAFINFADGLPYKSRKGSDFEYASEILELLKNEMSK